MKSNKSKEDEAKVKSKDDEVNGSSDKKQRKQRHKEILSNVLPDYARNSTLHGLRYITEKGLSIVEKVFWLLTFILSTAICFLLIRNVYIKWQNSPVIVTISEHMVPVGLVPFPSVTICPQMKVLLRFYNFTAEYNKFLYTDETELKFNNFSAETREELEVLQDLILVCDPYSSMHTILPRKIADESVFDRIFEVSPKANDVFASCEWRGEDVMCADIFNPVVTSEGICFNFNSLAANEIFRKENIQKEYEYVDTTTQSKNWSVTEGYTYYDPDPYPRRGRANGGVPDLQVLLLEARHETPDSFCNSLNSGYKIYIQHPADVPQTSLYYYAALPNEVSSLALKVNLISTSESLKDYSPEVRQCYFPSERPLRYFAIYTQSNCQLECTSNKTFERCGCVWFHMPHNDSRTICTANSRECAKFAQDEMTVEELKADLGFEIQACRCLPSCYNIHYDAEVIRTAYDFDKFIKTSGIVHQEDMSEMGIYKYSKFEMYFKEPRFFYFLANCGGLLGLFLGFSFLSLVEIAYFFTLRLCCTLRQDIRKEESQKKEDITSRATDFAKENIY